MNISYCIRFYFRQVKDVNLKNFVHGFDLLPKPGVKDSISVA